MAKSNNNIAVRLGILSWLEFAVWGAYLISMCGFLYKIGLGTNIGFFYAVQGMVSIFMPALMGMVADRWIRAERLLAICHAIAAVFMLVACHVGAQPDVTFAMLFVPYTISVAFYMPTLALSNSASYSAMQRYGIDIVKVFPKIRPFGTVGFIMAMWLVDVMGIQHTSMQFAVSAVLGLLTAGYSLSLPACNIAKGGERKSFVEMLGLNAFALFKQKQMALFFVFSMLLGISLQITNGYANAFISGFGQIAEYKDSFFTAHANILISLSQVSEAFCILLIPLFLSRYGIKNVMLIAMSAWALRFGFFAIGSPSWPGVLALIMSMVVYGVAFDFFNVSGSLFVDMQTQVSMRSSAQGLFMMMTNGLGATIGTMAAQWIINANVYELGADATDAELLSGWRTAWALFAAYAAVVAVLFAISFKEPKKTSVS